MEQAVMQASDESDGLHAVEESLVETARLMRDDLIQTTAALVRIPSENTPPTGGEQECQKLVLSRLQSLGIPAEMYPIGSVPGLTSHKEFRPGRDYTNRSNIAGVISGSGGGRSLILSGHIDTVPRGSLPWARDPFGGVVEGNRLYGLGANDMKGGVGVILTVLRILKEAGVVLRGDLRVETVVDEEFGGVNGTLAARLREPRADAAIICEPTNQAICPAQTGGRTAHVRLKVESGGILYEGGSPAQVTGPLAYLLAGVEEFARQRLASSPGHPLYAHSCDPVPVWITRIHMGGWGFLDPQTLPSSCSVEIYWQAMPGETQESIDREFLGWLEAMARARPDLFTPRPEVSYPFRWLPGSALDPTHPLVTGLAEAFTATAGRVPSVEGIGGPCDMYLFHQHFDIPAVLFGPGGGNTHAPDEWVDLDSQQLTVEALLRFICRWCEVDMRRSAAFGSAQTKS
jgi:acetylornithine deacetylase